MMDIMVLGMLPENAWDAVDKAPLFIKFMLY